MVDNDQSVHITHLYYQLIHHMDLLLAALPVEKSEFFRFPSCSPCSLHMPCDALQQLRVKKTNSHAAVHTDIGNQWDGMFDNPSANGHGTANTTASGASELLTFKPHEIAAALESRRDAFESSLTLALDAVTTSPLHQALHPAMSHFWIHFLGNIPNVHASQFLKKIDDVLRKSHTLDPVVRTRIKNVLISQLELDVTMHDDPSNHEQTIDFYSVAKLLRCVSRDETDIIQVLSIMSATWEHRTHCSLPPVCRTREVYILLT